MSDDKYMRAAADCVRIVENNPFMAKNNRVSLYELCAFAIRRELERPEPLEVGVRYRNTKANRMRIPINRYGESDLMIIRDSSLWPYVGFARRVAGGDIEFSEPAESVEWFMPIPDGEVRDE